MNDDKVQQAQEAISRETAKILQYKEAVIAAQTAGVVISNLTHDELIDMMLLQHEKPTPPP